MDELLNFSLQTEKFLPQVWTYMLLVARFTCVFLLIPGLSSGPAGLPIRLPAILSLSFVSMISGQVSAMPEAYGDFVICLVGECIFGMLLGLVPALITAGVQTAAQLSTGTMGLGAAQLLDPSLGVSVSSLGRIMTDSIICLFLLLGAHHVIIYAASGLGGQIVPGTFILESNSLQMIVQQTGRIFEMGALISAPVIVALLLTQFVMGLITKAVPTVNIFIVSFPLTIGIGLILSAIAIPELFVFAEKEFNQIEYRTFIITEAIDKIK